MLFSFFLFVVDVLLVLQITVAQSVEDVCAGGRKVVFPVVGELSGEVIQWFIDGKAKGGEYFLFGWGASVEVFKESFLM